MTQTAIQKPIDRLLDLLPSAKGPNGAGWYQAHCPAHNDQNRSLSFKEMGDETSEGVAFTCFAGCERPAILASLGVTEDELRLELDKKRVRFKPAEKPLEMIDLAVDKRIHWQYLMSLGIIEGTCTFHTKDGKPFQKKGVIIPYHKPDGTRYERYRLRTALKATDGTSWNEGLEPIIPYGLERLEQARQAGYLVIGEGESDCWTLWQSGFSALGIPGADNTACLKPEHLEGIGRVYIVQEPDKGGRKFALDVHNLLMRAGYQGKQYVLEMSAYSVKDPNELYKRDIKAFKATFEQVLQQARPLFKERQKPKLQRLRDLQQKELPETRWAIEPILPEGVTILGGKPKLGKSWLALAILSAIASGGVALGQYPVEHGEVLYVDLEDGEKRLKNRANTFLSNALASNDFYYVTECPRINEGGLDFLTETINEHPGLRLICIDTWARFKPRPQGRTQMQYDEDYDALQPLQKLASDKGISILVVDHMRKMESEDPIDQISGSVGKTGAVDGFLLLYRKRQETDAHLFVIGRDIEQEEDLMLSFSHECASWIVKGEANSDTVAATPERQAILDELSKHEQGLTCKELAKVLGKADSTIRNMLAILRHTERKVVYVNNHYILSSMHSNPSKGSNPSNPFENGNSSPGFTTPYYPPLVTSEPFADTPIEPTQGNGHYQVTGVTGVTTHVPKEHVPVWLTPGTYDWNKQVEKNGLKEMQSRREAWLAEHRKSVQVQA